jgi:beta-glucanase (GH16 family)
LTVSSVAALLARSAVLCTVAACGGASAAAPSPAPVPNQPGWVLAFADEFDSAGPLDAAKWGYELGYIRNNEKQFYTARPENVRAEDGNLVIEARKESYQGSSYTSASVNTRGRFEFLYGKVEVRARLPRGVGAWPAIWMLGANISQVGWPACGEIDIMENVGFDPLRIHSSVHTTAYNHAIGTQKSSAISIAHPEEFHVYAMEWRADRIDVFLDGQKYFTFANEGTGSRAWPFDKPHYLLVNLAVGGSWGGQKGIDDSSFPQRYAIDYVRIYRPQ